MNLRARVKWLLILALLASAATRAEIPEPPPAAVPAVAAQEDETPSEPPRDPFWPIGYKLAPKEAPRAEKPVSTEDEWQRARSKLRIGAVTKTGNRHLVLINGNTCQEGDVLAVELDGRIYRFQIKIVRMDRVEIRKLDVRVKPPPGP
jgi:hypothetical protein